MSLFSHVSLRAFAHRSRALLAAPLFVLLGGAWGDGCAITVEPIDPDECELACEYGLKHDSDGNAYCECRETDACIEIAAAPHENPSTGECVQFPSVCDIPDGWSPCEGNGCFVDGVAYAAGDDVPTDETCTVCRCRDDGEVICQGTPCAEPECVAFDGTLLQVGDTYDAGDGCNTCTCVEGGFLACTEMACPCDDGDCGGCFVDDVFIPPGGVYMPDECTRCVCFDDGSLACEVDDACVGPTCEFDGQVYFAGETFSPDGCNTCYCGEDGSVSCTEAECGCFVDDLWIGVGETVALGECTYCTCDFGGELICYALDYCVPGCQVGDWWYAPGDQFPADDGCNTCFCDENGQVSCTEMACCIDENGDGACDDTCEYNGAIYPVGESFPSADGCNTCACDANGDVFCTAMACAPEVDCDPANAFCDMVQPTCDEGFTVSIVNGCYGACVPVEQCATPNKCEGIVICAMAPPDCEPGFVPSVENGCWGTCIPEEECGN